MPFFGFEAIADGQTLTTAAAAGEDAAPNAINPGSAGSSRISGSAEHTHSGVRSGRVDVVPGSLATARHTGVLNAQGALRWYMRLGGSLGAAGAWPMELYSQAGSGYAARFLILGSGRARIAAPGTTDVFTTPDPIPVGEWVRCELWYKASPGDLSAGLVRFTMALGESEALLADSGVRTGVLGSRIPDGFRFGKIDSGAGSGTYWLDSITYEPGATGVLGPTVAPNQAPTVTLTPGRLTLDAGETTTITATAIDPDGTIASYAWATTAGELSGSGAAVTLRNPPDRTDRTATVTCTVTDDAGGTGSGQTLVALPQAARKVMLPNGMTPVVRRIA